MAAFMSFVPRNHRQTILQRSSDNHHIRAVVTDTCLLTNLGHSLITAFHGPLKSLPHLHNHPVDVDGVGGGDQFAHLGVVDVAQAQ